MTDDGGKTDFFLRMPVSRETRLKLEAYVGLVVEHSRSQNLVAASTIAAFWHRHMFDSAQLLRLAPSHAQNWLDVGSGAGLPGLVLSILSDGAFTLVEPRRLRAEFLRLVVVRLDLGQRVTIVQSAIEGVAPSSFDVITARAFSSLVRTIEATHHLAVTDTEWLLHKGRNAKVEVAEARLVWEGDYTLIPSETDPEASIVKLKRMRRRTGP